MTIQSNLYAERVFAEHPVALWPLDDNATYISLVDPDFRDISSGWTSSNSSLSEYLEEFPVSPYANDFTTKIETTHLIDESHSVIVESPVTIAGNTLSNFHKNFAFSGYFYTPSLTIESVQIGYRKAETLDKYVWKTFSVSQNSWMFLTATFHNPHVDDSIVPAIKINYVSNTGYVLVNGLSMGQWSENYAISSFGASDDLIPNIDIDGIRGIPAISYNSVSDSGYYVSNLGGLYAIDSGLPLCYGSRRSVAILNNNGPSMVFPGKGFLHNSGKNKTVSLEFWIRVNSQSETPKRIVGPISSDDGLYVDDAFLILKIGNAWRSHYVGNWGRPMLVTIVYDKGTANLLINGEDVMTIDVSKESNLFPTANNQDWIGFYAHEDVFPIDIDVIAIYPYRIPAIVSKRRFVYGQGLEFPSKIKGNVLQNTVSIDFANAKYSKNLYYPKNVTWNQGLADNVSITEKAISSPAYSLPDFIFSDKTYDDFINDSEELQDLGSKFVTFRPNENWADTSGYMVFNKLNMLNNDIAGFYGVFNIDQVLTSPETLMFLENTITKDYLKIFIDGSDIKYAFNSDSNIVHTAPISLEASQFLAGIDLDKFGLSIGQEVASFISNKNQLRLYVGSSSDFTQTFSGKIYSINLSTKRNLSKLVGAIDAFGIISQLISLDDPVSDPVDAGFYNSTSWAITLDSGTPSTESWPDLLDGGSPFAGSLISIFDHIASYSLKPRYYLGKFDLEIKTDSYWEDYVPLTHLATYVSDHSGDKIYSLDFIQINIDYPEARFLVDNSFDTSKLLVKTYVSFQPISSGANSSNTNFTDIPLSRTNIIDPGSSWVGNRYEVVNGSIIYPPTNIDINDIALVVHIEMTTEDLRRPISVRSLQLSSLALEATPKKIGTRFGNDIVPYSKYGPYFSYNSKNPFQIYKGTSPHLYLTSDSGISILGSNKPQESRGVSFALNRSKVQDYRISAMQLAIRSELQEFPENPIEIFEIQAAGRYIKFYVKSHQNNPQRGTIFALDGNTGLSAASFSMFLDGRLVKDPVISTRQWSMLSLSFGSSLSLDGIVGAFRITGPLLVNHFTAYELNEQDQASRFFYRVWGEVASEIWNYWTAEIWENVLLLADSGSFGVDTVYSYGEFTGTNRFILDSNATLVANNYKYSYYSDLVWQSQTLPAL